VLLYYVLCLCTGRNKNTKEEQYSKIVLPQLHREDTISVNNPSYESYIVQGSDVVIQPNPSYDVHKSNPEDQYEYVHTTEFNKHPSQHDKEDDVNMEPNPSYGVFRGQSNSKIGHDVNIEPNPSYKVATKMKTDTKTSPHSNFATTPYDEANLQPKIRISGNDDDNGDDDDDYI